MKYLKFGIPLLASVLYALPSIAATFESGGLGLARTDFVQKYGPEDKNCAIAKQTGGFFSCLKSGEIELPTTSNKNISDLHLKWRGALSIEESRRLAKNYIPKDSKLKKSYQSSSGSMIDVYFSPSLAARFPAEKWHEKAGEFITIHSTAKNKTILGINNNP